MASLSKDISFEEVCTHLAMISRYDASEVHINYLQTWNERPSSGGIAASRPSNAEIPT